ncbi:MAG TPA: cytochrome b/b6 domain-containing protein [Xanthomonadales bacterium]|nr:cytochrome b/b6 domain-containing protein [Xanthomonadales bacterium]
MPDTERFSSISIINHWVTALLVVVMLVLGYIVDAAPTDPIEHFVLGVHISLGFFLLLFVIWRVGVRIFEGFPESTGKTVFDRRAAWLVQRAILFFLVVLVLTGPLYLFTENECMDVFGWFSVCLPLESLSAIHEPVEWVHKKTGKIILPVLLGLHFLGAIRHYVIRDDQALRGEMYD